MIYLLSYNSSIPARIVKMAVMLCMDLRKFAAFADESTLLRMGGHTREIRDLSVAYSKTLSKKELVKPKHFLR